MSDYQWLFGETRCHIRVEGRGPERATMFVVSADGRTLRPIGDREGSPVVLSMDLRIDALGCAIRYLTERFGEWKPMPKFGWRYEDSPEIVEPAIRDERPI